MTVEQRLAKLEAKFKGLTADIQKRKLSQRVAALEKIVNKKPKPVKDGHGNKKK